MKRLKSIQIVDYVKHSRSILMVLATVFSANAAMAAVTNIGTGGATVDACDNDTIGSTSSVTITAAWTPNPYEITLDNANATTAGTAKIYTTYATNVYLDSARTKAMTAGTSGTNPITKPSRVYTVTYNGNNGTVGTTTAANTTSTYTFKGYYSASSAGTQYIDSAGKITADGLTAGKASLGSTWNAQWTSASVTLPTATRTGYTLKGWYDAATNGNKIGDASGSYTPTANKTLYAQWNTVSYTISYKEHDGTAITGLTPTTYTIESAAITLPTPTRAGYTFAGWYTTDTWTGTAVTTIPAQSTGNKTFYAKWTKALSYDSAGGSTVTTGDTTCSVDQTFTLPETPTREGYTFSGWTVNK